jgi:tetratricopeptide (TPR) repeat protein
LQLQSNYAEVYHLRGLAKYELKDYEGACSDWEKANQLNYSGVIDLIIEFCMEKGKN